VLNKIDRLTEEEAKQKFEVLKEKTKNPILISAKKKTNLDLLRYEILKTLEGYIQASFTMPMTNEAMPLLSWIHTKADVKKVNYAENNVYVIFEADPEIVEKAKKRVEELHGKLETNSKPQ
jgi:GTP-binding protein HflX